MKIWQKDNKQITPKFVEEFTVGRDRDFDLELAPWDVIGSLAHIRMLSGINLLSPEEHDQAAAELKKIHATITKGEFHILPEMEDVHSQIEWMLTQSIGDTGKKIHSGRSRNDQVLLAIKLYLRDQIREIAEHTSQLFHILIQLSERHQKDLMPGYTHLQLAMPSSFGLWFGAYAESLSDDLQLLYGAFQVINKNPLGSGAGYGSSFPLNRSLTTSLLGFEQLNYNVVYAQMTRGKSEKTLSFAMSSLAHTLSKLSMDICLFLNQHFNFISFPQELTTGSSIMPHKKNPDVFELIRARCNRIQSIPNEFALVYANLPSGYHRDYQLTKEMLFPGIHELIGCLNMLINCLPTISVRKNILNEENYRYLFSVEEVNNLVMNGTPFREAYRQIGQEIENNSFMPGRELHHTHEGSIGNLCLNEIDVVFQKNLAQFNFSLLDEASKKLLL